MSSVSNNAARPEDDPNNWFTAPEAKGPAIVTAIIGGTRWEIREGDKTLFHIEGPCFGLSKLFLKRGQSMILGFTKDGKVGVISGYRIPNDSLSHE